MNKAPVGTIVYAKKSSPLLPQGKLVIIDIVKQRSGNIVALLNTGNKTSFGNLTEVPCNIMGCSNCIYHPREPTDC